MRPQEEGLCLLSLSETLSCLPIKCTSTSTIHSLHSLNGEIKRQARTRRLYISHCQIYGHVIVTPLNRTGIWKTRPYTLFPASLVHARLLNKSGSRSQYNAISAASKTPGWYGTADTCCFSSRSKNPSPQRVVIFYG